jgi:hypothetical protein
MADIDGMKTGQLVIHLAEATRGTREIVKSAFGPESASVVSELEAWSRCLSAVSSENISGIDVASLRQAHSSMEALRVAGQHIDVERFRRISEPLAGDLHGLLLWAGLPDDPGRDE